MKLETSVSKGLAGTLVLAAVAIAGCGGDNFTGAQGSADASVDARPDVGAEADTETGSEAGPEAGRDAGPDSDAGDDAIAEAAQDVEPDVLPDVEPEAELDAQPDSAADAEPEAGPDAGQDAEPDAGPDAEPDVAPDGEPDTGEDADAADEPEAFVCPAIGRCDGLQPQACLTDHWEDYGGICNPHGACKPGGAGKAFCEIQGFAIDGDGGQVDRFDKPLIENLGLPDPNQYKSIAYALDTATDMRWTYNPIVNEWEIYSNDFTTGTFAQNQMFCSQADVVAPAHGGWTVPTLAQFQTIMPQAYPAKVDPRLVYYGVFIGTMPTTVPYCHWTTDQTTLGYHKAVWSPDGRVIDTADNTVCAFWCTKSN